MMAIMGMDAVQILMDCQEAFGIDIPDEAINLPTIGEFSDYVARRMPDKEPTVVWEQVREIASQTLITPIDQIRRDSRWTDLL